MASGRGSNIQSILQACEDDTLPATPVLVISNNHNSGALSLANTADLLNYYLSLKTHPEKDALDAAITRTMLENDVDLVVLAGYMKKIGPQLLAAYPDRIINIHPSLLPDFGGQGMYGINVHQAVIAAGEKESGATIHLVNDEYDRGRILAQSSVHVADDDTVETLAARVLTIEHQLYPDTLNKIIMGEISL